MTYRLTPARLTKDDARCQALFASSLQRSDAPGADVVAQAINAIVQQLGTAAMGGSRHVFAATVAAHNWASGACYHGYRIVANRCRRLLPPRGVGDLHRAGQRGCL